MTANTTCFSKQILDERGAKIFRTVIPENWFIKIICTCSHKTASFENILTVVQKLHGAEFVATIRFCEAVGSGEVDTLPAHFTDAAGFNLMVMQIFKITDPVWQIITN